MMPLSSKEKKQLFSPDEDIFNAFSDIFDVMGITKADIASEMYDWELPPLPQSEREKLGSSEGLLMTKDVMTGLEVAQPGGAMLYRGRPVLVYIRDQMLRRNKYERGWYNPFHICYCKSLREAKEEHRYENRYVLTYDTSGEFLVNLNVREDNYGSVYTEAKEQHTYRRLKVCQTCLYELNWKGFRKYAGPGIKWFEGGDKRKRLQMAENFSINEFLQSVRKLQFQPMQIEGISASGGTTIKKYSLTAEMKQQIKDSVNNICECCGETFTSRQLEIHHRNHNEGDNRRENLVVICKKCHDMIHQQEGGLRNKSQEDVSALEYGDINKNIGDMYSKGYGVKVNTHKAAEHYQFAAEGYESASSTGCAEADMKLGKLMIDGLVENATPEKAQIFFKKSADSYKSKAKNGDPAAMYALHIMYKNGWGCRKNSKNAEAYKQRAYSKYMENPSQWGADDCIRISQVAPEAEMAEKWKGRAAFLYGIMADNGSAQAGYQQAVLIESEKSDEDEVELPDTQKAFTAAVKSFAALSNTYEENQSLDKLAEKASLGNEKAVQKIGAMYLHGEKQGLEVLKQMAASGNQAAIQTVAKCAEAGDMAAIMAMGDIYVYQNPDILEGRK